MVGTVQFALFNLLTWGPYLVLGPVLARGYLGGARPWGVVMACYGGGAVLGGLLALGRRPRRPLVVAGVATFGFVLPPLALALLLPAPVVAGAALLAGLGSALGGALEATVTQQRVPAQALSRVGAYKMVGCVRVRAGRLCRRRAGGGRGRGPGRTRLRGRLGCLRHPGRAGGAVRPPFDLGSTRLPGEPDPELEPRATRARRRLIRRRCLSRPDGAAGTWAPLRPRPGCSSAGRMNSASSSTIRSPSDDWKNGSNATGVNPSAMIRSITVVIAGWPW